MLVSVYQPTWHHITQEIISNIKRAANVTKKKRVGSYKTNRTEQVKYHYKE
jgi:hypothetical protein